MRSFRKINIGLGALSRSGQATIEMILILTILFGLSVSISEAFSKNNYFATIIEGPWDYVDGMIRNGIWKKIAISTPAHPNAVSRHRSEKANPNSPQSGFDSVESCLATPPAGC